MSLPLAAAADRAMAQRLPRLAALLNRCPGSLFERITVPSEVASLEFATEVELLTETPEMVDAPITGEAPFTEGAVEGPNLATLTPGVNVMTGVAIGALHRLMAPELQALAQQGPTGPARLVPIMSTAVIWGLGALLARSQPVQGLTQVLNGVLQHVPFLGGQNWLAQFVQVTVGSQIGEMIGQHLRPQDEVVPSVPSVFLSEMCVVCHSPLREGVRVATLNCGHACLCVEDGCLEYWQREGDGSCPVCRHEPARVWAMVNV